jgi:hypothetical protein
VKLNDWYAGAMFVAALWAVCVPAIHITFAVTGLPPEVTVATTYVVGVFMTMLALILLALGSARVVAADIRRRSNG